MGADTLLAGANKMNGLQPFVKRQMAFLEDSPYANRKLLAAVAAFVEAVTLNPIGVFLAGLGPLRFNGVAVVDGATMRANAPVCPQQRLYVFEGLRFIVKIWPRQNGHDVSP